MQEHDIMKNIKYVLKRTEQILKIRKRKNKTKKAFHIWPDSTTSISCPATTKNKNKKTQTGLNIKSSCFQTLNNSQSSTMIPERRKTNQVTLILALASNQDTFQIRRKRGNAQVEHSGFQDFMRWRSEFRKSEVTEVSAESTSVERTTPKKSPRNPRKGHLASDVVQVAAQDCDPGEKRNR